MDQDTSSSSKKSKIAPTSVEDLHLAKRINNYDDKITIHVKEMKIDTVRKSVTCFIYVLVFLETL